MTDPQAILAGALAAHRSLIQVGQAKACSCGWESWSPFLTEAHHQHVAAVQAAALAEWLRSEVAVLVATGGILLDLDLDAEGSVQPHRASVYAVAALRALADELGATP